MRFLTLINLVAFTFVAHGFSPDPISDFVTLPSLKWKYQIKTPILASPVVEEGQVYFGGLDSTYYALDMASGKVNWKFRTLGAIRSTATFKGTTLYLNGGDGNLYALNKNTGKVLWTFAAKGEKKYDFADYHHSSPVLFNDVLYFGSGDGNLYAVRANDGSKVWSFQTGDAIHTTPAIANDKIYFGSFDGHVYAVNMAHGELAWKFKTIGQMFFPKGEVQGSPAVYKNMVIIGARDFNVYAISQQSGRGLWNRYFPKGWGLVNTVLDSVLHIGTGDQREFFAIDPKNGREYWSKKMELLVFGGNAYSTSMLYVPTTMGKLHAIDKRTGETKWTFVTESYQKNHLKYFKPDDSFRDDIYSIIKSNEQYLEAQYEMGGIFSTPAITSNEIVITTTDGTVYCLTR